MPLPCGTEKKSIVPERYLPEDPREWLNRARSDLTLAKSGSRGVYLEDLCFHAQQAVEKAVKALLTKRNVEFPYVHDIAGLLTLLERAGEEIPRSVRLAERLTRFAVFTRYPGVSPPVSRKEYDESIKSAEEVLRWAARIIKGKRG